MPNIKSAEKRMRQSVRRVEQNKPVRTRARNAAREAIAAIRSGGENIGEVVREAASALDRAAQKGVIHPNAAARRKSRLTRNAAKVQPETAPAPKTRARGTRAKKT